jgi:two-component system, LuxR family, sensor kinase FixL
MLRTSRRSRTSSKEADQFARALARGLVPVELELNGLSAALHRLVENAQRLFGVSCRFEEVGGEALIEDNTAATHFYASLRKPSATP